MEALADISIIKKYQIPNLILLERDKKIKIRINKIWSACVIRYNSSFLPIEQ